MDPRDPAPWPIITGLAVFAGGLAGGAAHTSYDVAAAFLWIAAAVNAYAAAHLTAANIVNRIRSARNRPARY